MQGEVLGQACTCINPLLLPQYANTHRKFFPEIQWWFYFQSIACETHNHTDFFYSLQDSAHMKLQEHKFVIKCFPQTF